MTKSNPCGKILCVAAIVLASSAVAMERTWTSMTGQYRVEATPLVDDLNGDGTPEIVVVNVEGQVLHWADTGNPLGSGPDGQVAQLPKGRWTSAPVRWRDRILFGSVEGLIVVLDLGFQPVWQYALNAETTWSRAVPIRVPASAPDGPDLMAIGDNSGKVTLLNYEGAAAKVFDPKSGPCRTFVNTIAGPDGQSLILAACGNSLIALDTSGIVLWATDLGGSILSRPEVLALPNRTLIVCAGGKGLLHAIDPQGKIIWTADIGMEIDSSITLLPREGEAPLILCTGLWGNLHAFDLEGKTVWEHVFRAKNRARPLLADSNADGRMEILVGTYRQTLMVMDAKGKRIDEIRFNGGINAAPTLLPRAGGALPDILVIGTTLQAHGLRSGPPQAPYGAAADTPSNTTCVAEKGTGIRVDNPSGALLRVNVFVPLAQGGERLWGRVSARSSVLFENLGIDASPGGNMTAIVQTANGEEILKQAFPIGEERKESAAEKDWCLQVAEPFGDSPAESVDTLRIENLYRNETEAGAVLLRSSLAKTTQARFSVESLVTSAGANFAGNIALFAMTPVGTVNGESVEDALLALAPANLLQVPPNGCAKIWVSVSADNSPPGDYTGKIVCRALDGDTAPLELPLVVSVPDLGMPTDFPLSLCTWDYLPNQWFPARTPEILRDMHAHGVNLFPRSVVPTAEINPAGELQIDWTALDAELVRLNGLGQALFHIGRPTIKWPSDFAEANKRAKEIDYLHAFRDHLARQGWGYDRYSLYPVDEPGLDNGKNSVPAFLEAATLFREADPKLRIYTDPVPSLSWADFQRIAPFVDVWCPNMRLVSGLLSNDPRMRSIMNAQIVIG